MARGVADLLEVVVLAAGANALLGGRGPAVTLGGLFLPEEDLLELDHPCIGKEQGWVIPGDEGGAGPDGMRLTGEIIEKTGADFVGAHIPETYRVARALHRAGGSLVRR
jgi:hypothetical protein